MRICPTLSGRFNADGDDIDTVILLVAHGRCVMPQEAERYVAVVLDVWRLSEIRKLILEILAF